MSTVTPDEFSSTTFDYVVIGGGAAGLVVAGRLSEDEDVTVGVIEAGSDQSKNPAVTIPGLALQIAGNPELDWNFKTAPQTFVHDRSFLWPRGKGLGGSAAINTMMYSHCSKRDLNSWELLGNKGWNWDSMEPYYRKLETYTAPPKDLGKILGSSYIDPSLRGTSGPIQTTLSDSTTEWVEQTWIATCKNAGYPEIKDPRLGVSLGGYSQLVTVDPNTKTRSYSHSGYIAPHVGRKNLKVLVNAKVAKVHLSAENGEAVATGARFIVDGKEYDVKVTREVICSAGSIQTPQILELSGIGNRSLLEKQGIKVLVDNPAVGENLQDHPMSMIGYQVHDDLTTMETIARNPEFGVKAMEAYAQGKGPLTGGLTATGFSSLHMICPELDDTQINELVDRARQFQSTTTAKQLRIQEDQLRDPDEASIQWILGAAGLDFSKADESVAGAFGHSFAGSYCSLLAVSTHMFSRGNVHINTNDPLAHPTIDPKYMSHPLDAELIGRAVLHARQLLRTEPFKSKFKQGPDGDLIVCPGFRGPYKDPKTVEEAKEFVKWNSMTCYHPIGTASMLPRHEGGVVDTDLRVYGTKNLRVIDASIFPLHVQGNIMSLVYAIAERGADIIKAARKN